jgi:hypothetical protein
MKKLILLYNIILCSYCFAEAPENNVSKRNEFLFGFDIGTFGITTFYDMETNISFDFNLNLVNINIENKTTCIGMTFIPINYSYSTSTKEHTLSFTTLFLYWNLYELFTKNDPYKSYDIRYIVGPFLSIQTLNLNNFNNFNRDISYSVGLKFSRVPYLGNSKIIGVCPNLDIGYNYFNEKHRMFISLNFSYLVPVIIVTFFPMILNGGF